MDGEKEMWRRKWGYVITSPAAGNARDENREKGRGRGEGVGGLELPLQAARGRSLGNE